MFLNRKSVTSLNLVNGSFQLLKPSEINVISLFLAVCKFDFWCCLAHTKQKTESAESTKRNYDLIKGLR